MGELFDEEVNCNACTHLCTMGMAEPIHQSISRLFRRVHAIQIQCDTRKMPGHRLRVRELKLGAPIDWTMIAVECHHIRHLLKSRNSYACSTLSKSFRKLTFAHWYRGIPITTRHAYQFGVPDQGVAIDARQLNACVHSRLARIHFESPAILYFRTIDGFDNHMDRMVMPCWCLARVNTCVVFDGIENAQTIFECAVATLLGHPTLGVIAMCMIYHPFRIAKPSHPQAFHMHGCARMND